MRKQNPGIEKRQLPGNGAKNLIGRIEVLIFINPKRKACCRVLVVSSAGSWVSTIGTQFDRVNLD